MASLYGFLLSRKRGGWLKEPVTETTSPVFKTLFGSLRQKKNKRKKFNSGVETNLSLMSWNEANKGWRTISDHSNTQYNKTHYVKSRNEWNKVQGWTNQKSWHFGEADFVCYWFFISHSIRYNFRAFNRDFNLLYFAFLNFYKLTN